MISATSSGFRVSLSVPAAAPDVDPCSWYDAKCHALSAADALNDWLAEHVHHFVVWLGHQIIIGIGITLPTLAAIGVIWWMCGSFVPKASWGPRLTGFSLLAYMFYILLGGGA